MVLMLLAVFLLPSLASAQLAPEGETTAAEASEEREIPEVLEDDRAARRLFLRASTAFEEERYEDALESFRLAHELSGRAALLYNIALSLEKLERSEEAVMTYREYLVAVPESTHRVDVQARVSRLQHEVSRETELSRDAITRSRAGTPEPAPTNSLPLVTALSGVGVAVLGGALVVVGAVKVSNLEDTPFETRQWSAVGPEADRALRLQIAGYVTVGVGLAAGAVGLLLHLLRRPATQGPVSLRAGGLQWRF